jgi:uncharacterized protein
MPTRAILSHFAINADDVNRARRFYEKAFGFKFTSWGPPGFYQLDTGGPNPVQGALQGRREIVPGKKMFGFECTLAVDDIDAAEKRILGAGGKIAMPRSVIAGVGTLMFFEDTEGNVFGAMQYDERAG